MSVLDDSLWSIEFAGAAGIRDWDSALAREVLAHFSDFATDRIAPLNSLGDLQGCALVNGRVHLPDGFITAYKHLAADGWQGLSAPEEFGGQGLGPVIQALVSEAFSGACHALQMVTGLVPGAIRLLRHVATPAQQARYIPPLASGAWLATMCLTEAGAGSDLSGIRTRATHGPQGWTISGEKIFISGGDQDASENILHLVLARTGPEGTRGLSLFACPALLPDGRRNGVRVERLERKMGLHASPTCHMVFDGCEGELIGEPGHGLAAMFLLMNHARLDVALQGVAHAARAHAVALSYARARQQGRMPDGSAATLAQHADVRRMLDDMDRRTLAARALAHTALVALESGNDTLANFMTPMAKVAGSEAGMRVTEAAMQVLGGYGYLHEYGLEQAYRDARICAIYEGANGIHALTLAKRGLGHAGGAQAAEFGRFIAQIAQGQADRSLSHAFKHWKVLSEKVVTAREENAHLFMQSSIALAELAFWQRVVTECPDDDRLQALAPQAQRRAGHIVESCLQFVDKGTVPQPAM
ncbi:acyl-CoA dehydrogenase family protein [Roseinatronobacter sp.]|uniref:acyl-CoA dehydrogenase family protein n=1 Tax=Roseinatronobacter sp. TaxID=1945755 RepID=UPI0025D22294|nr:acyl-CoA dehydrogenase family protein [Rhodobaca sp.]